jgi:hypothetical protein
MSKFLEYIAEYLTQGKLVNLKAIDRWALPVFPLTFVNNCLPLQTFLQTKYKRTAVWKLQLLLTIRIDYWWDEVRFYLIILVVTQVLKVLNHFAYFWKAWKVCEIAKQLSWNILLSTYLLFHLKICGLSPIPLRT